MSTVSVPSWMVTRAEWGAAPPTRPPSTDPLPWTRLWLHHTAGPTTQTPKQIQAYHQKSNGWRDIAYNLLVDVSGTVYEGIGVGVRHLNTDAGPSGTVCLIGNFDTYDMPPAMVDAVARLAAYGHDVGWWVPVGFTGGHRDIPGAKPTACPGRYAHAQIPTINNLAARYSGTDDQGDDDMYGDWDRIRDQIAAESVDELLRFNRAGGTQPIPDDMHSGAEALLTINARVADLWNWGAAGTSTASSRVRAALLFVLLTAVLVAVTFAAIDNGTLDTDDAAVWIAAQLAALGLGASAGHVANQVVGPDRATVDDPAEDL